MRKKMEQILLEDGELFTAASGISMLPCISFLTGAPGAGKTYVLNEFIRQARADGASVSAWIAGAVR